MIQITEPTSASEFSRSKPAAVRHTLLIVSLPSLPLPAASAAPSIHLEAATEASKRLLLTPHRVNVDPCCLTETRIELSSHNSS